MLMVGNMVLYISAEMLEMSVFFVFVHEYGHQEAPIDSVNLKIITKLRNRLTPSKNHMLRLHSEAANRLHSRWCGSENSTEAHQALLGGDWWGKRAPERRGLLT